MNDYSCYVTIRNRSALTLRNPQYDASFGTWAIKPPSNVESKAAAACRLEAVWYLPAGAAAEVEYQAGKGKFKLVFQCNYLMDNKVGLSNDGAEVRLSFYANNEPDYAWSSDGRDWGKEGQYPSKGHPLSVLLVVDDLEK